MKNTSVNHTIQKHIIDVLKYQQVGRFSELRPLKVDTNLFTYHVNALLKTGIIAKVSGGYTLSPKGLSYVNRESNGVAAQLKINIMLVIQNSEGDILLQRRTQQPYISAWALPCGNVEPEDVLVQSAAQRVVLEKMDLKNVPLEHAGDCYVRVRCSGELLSAELVHVFRLYHDDIRLGDTLMWARPHKLQQLNLAPAVEEVMTRTFFKDTFYFEEYNVDWQQA